MHPANVRALQNKAMDQCDWKYFLHHLPVITDANVSVVPDRKIPQRSITDSFGSDMERRCLCEHAAITLCKKKRERKRKTPFWRC